MLSTLWECVQLYNPLRADSGLVGVGVCPLCAGPAGGGRFCCGCEADLPYCRDIPVVLRDRELTGVHAAFDYVFPIAGLLRAAKFHADVAALRALALAFSDHVAPSLTGLDVAIPIPLTCRRYVQRGYNQSTLLSTPLTQRCKCLLLANALKVKGGRPAQSRLGRAGRAHNIAGAFTATRRLDGLRVLLIDDVVTTGATLTAAAAAVLSAGASEVIAAVLAATPRKLPA